jgi:hypothetical protein
MEGRTLDNVQKVSKKAKQNSLEEGTGSEGFYKNQKGVGRSE